MAIYFRWRFLHWNETWLLRETKSHETISWDDFLYYYSSVWIKLHITLEAITDITILVRYLSVKSLWLVWSLNLRVPDLQMGCRDLTSWPGAPTLQWRHNEGDGVSNRLRLDCLFDLLFKRRSKKASKLQVTGFSEGNPPVTGGFPSQRANNAENVSMWWRHQG